MSRDSFNEAFDRVIGNEGGYTNDPNDPGGETNWGISKRAYPALNIKELPKTAAQDIYYRDFWLVIHGDDLTESVGYQLFDFAVNSGIQTAIRYFQRALDVADDGYFGPISVAAIARTRETDMILNLNAERLDYMTRLSNWPNAGKGWARRIAQNLKYGAEDT